MPEENDLLVDMNERLDHSFWSIIRRLIHPVLHIDIGPFAYASPLYFWGILQAECSDNPDLLLGGSKYMVSFVADVISTVPVLPFFHPP